MVKVQPASILMTNNIPKEVLEELLSAIDLEYCMTLDRKRLYERGFREYSHLPELAMKWFQEILDTSPGLGEL